MTENPLLHKAFAAVIAVLATANLVLLLDRIDLSNTNSQQVQDFYSQLSNGQVGFTDTGQFIFPDEEKFLDLKGDYIKNGLSFVEINLRTMTGALYDSGQDVKDFKVLAKGREGSWWETPTGSYQVINKEQYHFSSIAHVWMPYSVQFYSSFFIHGWPFYQNGQPIPSNVRGSLGCIRLSDADARAVYDFAKPGMRILVLEDQPTTQYGRLVSKGGVSVPATTASSLLVANLATGEAVIKKQSGDVLPMGTLTKFMAALTIADLLNPEQQVKVSASSLADALNIFEPQAGQHYTVLDLLYPLLMQGSDEAAAILAERVGPGNLLINMNSKAKSLGMSETRFRDYRGNDTRNVSSADDLLKALQQVLYKRSFLFDIAKGKKYFDVGPEKLGGISNLNSFSQEAGTIGSQSGKVASGQENAFVVQSIAGAKNNVPVAVIVMGSEDATADAQNILDWVKNNFTVK